MTQVEINKLKKRIERQQANEYRKAGNYSVGVKKAKGTKFSTNNLWNHNHIPMSSTHEVVINGSIETIIVNGKKYVKVQK